MEIKCEKCGSNGPCVTLGTYQTDPPLKVCKCLCCGHAWTEDSSVIRRMEGLKHDDNVYDKVDLSLIPDWVFVQDFSDRMSPEMEAFYKLHRALNSDTGIDQDDLRDVLRSLIQAHGLRSLAVSLGYGREKYGRDNWRLFDSDPERFLRASLRHLYAHIKTGAVHDGESFGRYDLGNSHIGGACFGIIVALHVLEQ